MIANALVGVGQASAQGLVDVAALEAQVEAAAELVELPAESDWGVQDLSDSLPVVERDAPGVPPAAPEVAEAAPAPRYHRQEPQYHTEYQAPEANPVPVPVDATVAPAPAEEEAGGSPASPVPTAAPALPSAASAQVAQPPVIPQAPSTPTIWIWVWNWTWVQGSDERYHNSEDQYYIDASTLDQNLIRIIDRMGTQIPVQIGGNTEGDLVKEILNDEALAEAELPSASVAIPPAAPIQRLDPRVPSRVRTSAQAARKRPERAAAALERLPQAPLALAPVTPRVLASPDVVPARAVPRSKTPRVRRASRPKPTSPLQSARFGDTGSASSASAGVFLKSFAVLIASLVLAVLGRGRRLRLPSTRWRGLLGTRTDPPG